MQNSLILKNISKEYNSLKALSDFNLICNKGEIIVLLGENGSGKSTLISILSGIIQPSNGDIFIDEKKVCINSAKKSFEEKIGVVFQHSNLIQEFTIIENLLLSKSWHERNDSSEAILRFDELIKFLDISLSPHTLVKDLSLVEQQLVELVRALWFNQEIILLDELTAHLIKDEVEKLGKILRILANKGCIILFITHKLDEAIQFADKIAVLQKGVKTLEIDKEEINKHSNDEIEKMLYKSMFSQDFSIKEEQNTKNSIEIYKENPFFILNALSTIQRNNEINCIKDISFQVHRSEIFGIYGIEGQGQKILAEVLAGLRENTGGAITLDNNDISKTNLRTRQELGIYYVGNKRIDEEIAIGETIGINLQLKNLKDKNYFRFARIIMKNIQDFACLIMKELEILAKHKNSPIENLSGGNMQKVILKRALSQSNRRIILLHQPSYGIDLKTKKELHLQILNEAKKGCAFILISNDIEELLSLSNRISIIKQGMLTKSINNDEFAYDTITASLSNYSIGQ